MELSSAAHPRARSSGVTSWRCAQSAPAPILQPHVRGDPAEAPPAGYATANAGYLIRRMDISHCTDGADFQEAPENVALAPGEVHLWAARLPLPAEELGRCESVLTPDERSRAAIPPLETERGRFVAVRGVLRILLGRYLGAPPAALIFEYGEQGKPALAGSARGGMRFNVSHAGDVALLAFARGREVGVDVEKVREVPRAERIATRVFTLEAVERWRALPEEQRPETFMREWTRLEALSKLTGEGVWRTVIAGEQRARPDVQSFELRPQPGYVGTLAVEGGGLRLRTWRYQVGSPSSSASSSSGGSGGAK